MIQFILSLVESETVDKIIKYSVVSDGGDLQDDRVYVQYIRESLQQPDTTRHIITTESPPLLSSPL